MKVLVVHNYYRLAGGEDRAFHAEAALLEAYGHTVVRYTVHNDAVDTTAPLRLARNTVWNRAAQEALQCLLKAEQPDVAHFHNTLPLLSPSVYYAAKREGAAVVQTLHNYRLLCPNALFLREGVPCEDCLGRRLAWPAVLHACYRGSRAASATVALMLATHRAAGTWAEQVDAYVALSPFARGKFIEGGLPPEKLHVRPNFVPDAVAPGPGGDGFVFAGRLSEEKGLATLLAAWDRLEAPVPLTLIGEGPLEGLVRAAQARHPHVAWAGALPNAEVVEAMRHAAAVIVPSQCYENAPLALVEAYAAGSPVLASRIGSLPGFVEEGRTGLLFAPGDAAALAAAVTALRTHPDHRTAMRAHARAAYEASYTPAAGYARLMEIYDHARRTARASQPA